MPQSAESSKKGRLLEPGRNCWRVTRANRAAFLIDGEAHFSAFQQAAAQARKRIMILGWDVDSRMRLVRGERVDDFPAELGDFLFALLKRRKELHIYILTWEFAMIYAFDREWTPLYDRAWRRHRRLHFRLDGFHPVGASQHQKIVIIDNAIAFCGGFDLSKHRWDTSEHRPEDSRRTDANGEAYAPFHDVQMLVDGQAAQALGELARDRWETATGEKLEPVQIADHVPWPDELSPDMTRLTIGLARTFPAYRDRPEVREIEQLYLDMIASAKRWIYIESQYFTSSSICDALAQRLSAREGPEVVAVLPLKTGGWLEQLTMDVLRSRILKKLREADRHQRLKVYYPDVPGLDRHPLIVHTKLMIADGTLLQLGSANLSNRSMGLDSECNVVIESLDHSDLKDSIETFHHRLLAEHLGCSLDKVRQAMKEAGGLIAAIEALAGQGRTLRPLDGTVDKELDEQIPDAFILDPERPIEPETLVERFLDSPERKSASRQLLSFAGLALVLLILAAAWRWTPLGHWIHPDRLAAFAGWLRDSPSGIFALIGGYVAASFIAFPLTLLIVATVAIFQSVSGCLYALLGALTAAVAAYGAGYALGREAIRRLAGSRINRVSRYLGRRGLLTMVVVRLVPIAPFTLVNVVAGASHIRFRDFVLGSLIGMAPGVFLTGLLAHRVMLAVTEPGVGTLATLAGVVALIGVLALGVARWLKGISEQQPGPQ